MELSDYGHVIRRYWPFIALTTVLGVLIAGGMLMVTPKRFQAHAEVLISIEGASTVDDINAGSAYLERAMPTFAGLATSQSVIDPAARKLGLQEGYDDVVLRVSVNPKESAFLLDVVADGTDGDSAADLANAVSSELDRVLTSSVSLPRGAAQRFHATQVTVARPPASPLSPRVGTFLGMGLLGGLAVGLTLAVAQARFQLLRVRHSGRRDRPGGPVDQRTERHVTDTELRDQ